MYVKKTVLALFLVVALLVGGAAAVFAGRLGVNSNYTLTKEEYDSWQYMQSTYGKMDRLKKMMESSYYISVDGDKLIESAYYGLIEGLEDPYSEYVSKEEYEDYFSSMIGEYSGVGMSFFNNLDGVLEVVQVFRNSPAKEAGMQPGDIILKVDGKEYSGAESSEAAANIRGKDGTTVEITYRRNGVENTISLVRAPIEVETVDHSMLEDSIGYIYIESFESATAKDFKAALDDLTAQGARALIVDLRNNGGGLVDIAVEIADMLMEQGTVVYTMDHDGQKGYYRSKAGRTKLPYVLLVNGYTASASEILSAGIQDNNEGKIIGTLTYGKGIIQTLQPLPDGSAVKFTISQYFSPSGKTIHKVGITPDYVVELVEGDDTDYQLQKAIEVLGQ